VFLKLFSLVVEHAPQRHTLGHKLVREPLNGALCPEPFPLRFGGLFVLYGLVLAVAGPLSRLDEVGQLLDRPVRVERGVRVVDLEAERVVVRPPEDAGHRNVFLLEQRRFSLRLVEVRGRSPEHHPPLVVGPTHAAIENRSPHRILLLKAAQVVAARLEEELDLRVGRPQAEGRHKALLEARKQGALRRAINGDALGHAGQVLVHEQAQALVGQLALVVRLQLVGVGVDEAIAKTAITAANSLGVKAIAAMTESGATAMWMSRIGTDIPIYALSEQPRTRTKVTLYRGVHPISFDPTMREHEAVNREAVAELQARGAVSGDDYVLITKGDLAGVRGGTNAMKVVKVSEIL